MNGRALIAWNVRALRVARGLSQEALAADAGVDRAYLGGLEREQENPTVDVRERLANTLDIELAALFKKPRAGAKPPETLPAGRRRA